MLNNNNTICNKRWNWLCLVAILDYPNTLGQALVRGHCRESGHFSPMAIENSTHPNNAMFTS